MYIFVMVEPWYPHCTLAPGHLSLPFPGLHPASLQWGFGLCSVPAGRDELVLQGAGSGSAEFTSDLDGISWDFTHDKFGKMGMGYSWGIANNLIFVLEYFSLESCFFVGFSVFFAHSPHKIKGKKQTGNGWSSGYYLEPGIGQIILSPQPKAVQFPTQSMVAKVVIFARTWWNMMDNYWFD